MYMMYVRMHMYLCTCVCTYTYKQDIYVYHRHICVQIFVYVRSCTYTIYMYAHIFAGGCEQTSSHSAGLRDVCSQHAELPVARSLCLGPQVGPSSYYTKVLPDSQAVDRMIGLSRSDL